MTNRAVFTRISHCFASLPNTIDLKISRHLHNQLQVKLICQSWLARWRFPALCVNSLSLLPVLIGSWDRLCPPWLATDIDFDFTSLNWKRFSSILTLTSKNGFCVSACVAKSPLLISSPLVDCSSGITEMRFFWRPAEQVKIPTPSEF